MIFNFLGYHLNVISRRDNPNIAELEKAQKLMRTQLEEMWSRVEKIEQENVSELQAELNKYKLVDSSVEEPLKKLEEELFRVSQIVFGQEHTNSLISGSEVSLNVVKYRILILDDHLKNNIKKIQLKKDELEEQLLGYPEKRVWQVGLWQVGSGVGAVGIFGGAVALVACGLIASFLLKLIVILIAFFLAVFLLKTGLTKISEIDERLADEEKSKNLNLGSLTYYLALHQNRSSLEKTGADDEDELTEDYSDIEFSPARRHTR